MKWHIFKQIGLFNLESRELRSFLNDLYMINVVDRGCINNKICLTYMGKIHQENWEKYREFHFWIHEESSVVNCI